MTRLTPQVDFARRFFRNSLLVGLGSALFCSGAIAQTKGSPEHIKAVTSAVDSASIKANTATSNDWPTIGLDYAETRFSKLNKINADNVKQLGLVWSYPLESSRGVEATPVVVDGIMYVTASWSVVHAIDARTGKKIWTFDPGVDREKGYKGCCDVVNRGVALYKGKVFVGAYDGRLIALDAVTGQKVWEKDTLIDKEHSYTITGAPRVFNGKVVIGNGGAEYGARGYVTAYDAETGNQAWRWFTVPGDPSKPFEDESMAAAAKTWDPAGKYWINGGGGTAWDTITFDPDLNMVYIGTGNGSPWNRDLRSPAGGDNLYLASLVALNADTGKYIWHYQENPGDHWDYTSTQPMILADINIDGAPRKVILHAPKNGFFFVVDRTNGKFISAKNFVDVNWATGYDAERPADRDTGGARSGGPRQHPRPVRRPQLAPDVVQSADRPRLSAGAGRAFEPDAGKDAEAERRDARQIRRGGRLERRLHAQRHAAEEPRVRTAAGLGSGETEGSLAGGICGAMEWRHVDHRRKSGVPGHRRRALHRLQRHLGRKALGNADRDRRGGGSLHLPDRRQAICVGRGRLGRRIRHLAARHRAAKPRNGLYLRARRQGASSGLCEVPDRRPARRCEVRSEGRA